jgi:hypothetical protein
VASAQEKPKGPSGLLINREGIITILFNKFEEISNFPVEFQIQDFHPSGATLLYISHRPWEAMKMPSGFDFSSSRRQETQPIRTSTWPLQTVDNDPRNPGPSPILPE